MCDFGFEVIGMDKDEEKNITEDYFDINAALKKEPISKRGDIFKLGNHQLMCGDSTSLDDIEKLVSNNKIDLIFTDPPYGISIVNKNNEVGSENIAKNKVYKKVLNDNTTETAKKACELLFKICDKSIIWGGNYFVDFLPFSDGWIIWDKRVDMNSNNFADGEMAWCSFHTPVRIYHQLWNGMIREGEKEERVHPTQKPVRMIGEILRDFSKEKDIIIDTFGGSGSTLIACEKMKRTCFMMEYDPEYVDLIIRRWEEYTGEKAEKIKG